MNGLIGRKSLGVAEAGEQPNILQRLRQTHLLPDSIIAFSKILDDLGRWC